MRQSVTGESMKEAPSPTEESGVQEVDSLNIDPAEERRIIRKLDWCLIPLMGFFFFFAYLDRANIGNANVAGLQKDLGLTDHQYQICVTVNYAPYVAAELPANLLLRRISPGIMLPTLVTIWGIICALQGTVASYGGLVTTRALLGLFEGPMLPGMVLYLSGFYKRGELSLKIAMFYSGAALAGAFSGLFSFAIVKMDGLGGRPGWAWIFILEGVLTVIFGLCSFFLTPSTPQKVRFLTQRERDFIERRLILDRPTSSPIDAFSFKQVWRSMSSPHVFFMCIIFFTEGTAFFGLAIFLPTIVNQLGYSPTHTQLISVGPFAVASAVILAAGYLSDRMKRRSTFVMIGAAIAMTGYVIFLRSTSITVSYGSLFLSVTGMYSLPTLLTAWMANNSEPHYRRATSIALGIVWSNSGGILSSWLFPSKEAPRYRRATILSITFSALVFIFAAINALYLTWMNRRKQQRRAELLAPYVKEDVPHDGGDRAWIELGDKHPDFQYAL